MWRTPLACKRSVDQESCRYVGSLVQAFSQKAFEKGRQLTLLHEIAGVVSSTEAPRSRFRKAALHYESQWRDTNFYIYRDSMYISTEDTSRQSRYTIHDHLLHASPEAPVYVLELKSENHIEVLISHDWFQGLPDDLSLRICRDRMPFCEKRF